MVSDEQIDELLFGEKPTAIATSGDAETDFILAKAGQAVSEILFFDLETVPCWESAARIGIKEIVPPQPTPEEDLPHPSTEGLTEAEVKERFGKIVEPPEAYLETLKASEQLRPKPRKGVGDFLGKLSLGSELHVEREKQLKKLSTSPPANRIVAMAWRSGVGGQTLKHVVGEHSFEPFGERDLLQVFWDKAKRHRTLCGYNIAGFDIPTIKARSVKLEVPATRLLGHKRYDDSLLDLFEVIAQGFYGNTSFGRLKDLAPLMGIDVATGETCGSDVYNMYQAGELEALAKYAMSDVDVVVDLYKLCAGTYF